MPDHTEFFLRPRRVYALLVGIDAYRADVVLNGRTAFAPLRGCVADVMAVKNWIEKRPGLAAEVLTLTNGQATKGAIAQAMDEHLGQAQEGDTALFYFSGHGALEAADPRLWPSETDGRLESVVCYADGQAQADWLLADKELRWLIGRLWAKTRAHIALVFDCCHSGDNTRLDRAIPRRAYPGAVFPVRPWSDFLFASSLDAADVAAKPIDEVLPPGRYVQLSASESNEAAVEVAGRGVFTQALLESLDPVGALPDYRQLNSQVRQRLRHRYSQRPRLYAPEAEDAAQAFLGGEVADAAGWITMVYQPAGGGHYVALAGAAHGLKAGHTEVWAEAEPALTPLRGMVEEAQLDEAKVNWSAADAALLGQAPRQVRVAGTYSAKLRLYLDGGDDEAVFEPLMEEWPANWQLCDEEQAAQYAIYGREGWWWPAAPADPNRPLAQPLRAANPKSIYELRRYLAQMERYHFLRDELAPASGQSLPESLLGLEAFIYDVAAGPTELLPRTEAGWTLDYEPIPQGGKREIGIAITNLGDEDLYVAAIIYGFDFSVNPTYLLPTTIMLEAGERKWLRDHKSAYIKLEQDPRVYWYHWPAASDTVQFVLSNAPFDLSWMKMEGLPGPLAPGGPLRAGRDSLPGWADRLSGTRWNVVNVKLNLRNPWYGAMPAADSYFPVGGEAAAWWARWA